MSTSIRMYFLPLILIAGLFFSKFTFAKNCLNVFESGQFYNELVTSTNIVLNNNQQSSMCQNISVAQDKNDIFKIIDNELEIQALKIKEKKPDSLTNIFNKCEPNKSSTTLVLSFTGTGSFEPQSHHLMSSFLKCSQSHALPDHLKKLTSYYIQLRLAKSLGHKTKWSGIEAGPLLGMLNDKDLAARATNFDFVSFPSEESKILTSPQSLSLSDLRSIPREIIKSQSGRPKGIQDALNCTNKYFKKAKELGIKPKLVILSHSSGARSTVKFLEALKTIAPQIKADLVFSMDPVKEAQHAIQEVLSQAAGNVGNKILSLNPLIAPKTPKPINVWTRSQPQSLYKTSNAKKWINVYQNKDSHGLDLAIKFGIHGSPIKGADQNVFINDGLGSKAHGEIVKHQKVLELFKKHLKEI